MLFTTVEFLFLFLPTVLLLFYAAQRWGGASLPKCVLLGASLVFYGWFKWSYLSVILFFIGFNYALPLIAHRFVHPRWRKRLIAAGVIIDLGVLAYFKYATFIVENLSHLTGVDYAFKAVFLPLAISFFTFKCIMYLLRHKETAPTTPLLDFAGYITFFPHLVAGPIVRPWVLLPQIRDLKTHAVTSSHWAAGLILIAIGAFKKLWVADSLAPYVDKVFSAAGNGMLTTQEAWVGALGFTFQIYFDFSGYTDIALGLALLFGVHLSLNFNSPYKAASIIEFWRRWHITLSTFLRDYVYIPLGGNRKGVSRRYSNLLATMLIGGLWHGAAWNFVVWGGLHGALLAINHGWRAVFEKAGLSAISRHAFYRLCCWVVTMLCLCITWVFFRASDHATAGVLIGTMFTWGDSIASTEAVISIVELRWLAAAGLGILLWQLIMPNAVQLAQLLHREVVDPQSASLLEPVSTYKGVGLRDSWLAASAGIAAAFIVFSVVWLWILRDHVDTPFIYFQF